MAKLSETKTYTGWPKK